MLRPGGTVEEDDSHWAQVYEFPRKTREVPEPRELSGYRLVLVQLGILVLFGCICVLPPRIRRAIVDGLILEWNP